MATVYVKFGTDDEREAGLKKLFGLNDEDEAAGVLLEKVKDSYSRGGLTIEITYVKNPMTPYQELMNRLAEIGVTGIRFQKTYKSQKASWLAIRVKTVKHKKKLDKGLKELGFEVME